MYSEQGRRRVLVCYDIVDDSQRQAVATLLEGYGERVQGSVFEVMVDASGLRQLKTDLECQVNVLTDRVRFYSLCQRDSAGMISLGVGPGVVDTAYWLL